MKHIKHFLCSQSFWFATTLILIGVVLTLFGEHNQFISKVFLNKDGRFEWTVLAGITAVYSFIYSIYLNSHKEKVEIVLKPEIERDQMISDLLSNYLALSTRLATDINKAIGDKLYRFHDPDVQLSSRKLDELIQDNYPKFLLTREKLQLEIKPDSDSQKILAKVNELHTNVEACLKSYNRCISKLDMIESQRESSAEVPDDLKSEFIMDPGRPGVYISNRVKDMFNDVSKPARISTYNTRKELRTLATEYLDTKRTARRKLYDF